MRFLNHRPKAWWNRNSIQGPRYDLVFIYTKNIHIQDISPMVRLSASILGAYHKTDPQLDRLVIYWSTLAQTTGSLNKVISGCPLTSSWPLKNMHSMLRWSTTLLDFLLPNSPVATWSPEKNHLGDIILVFQCCVLPSPTEGHTKIFFIILHHFQHFFSCSPHCLSLDKVLTRSIVPVQTLLLSSWYLHPATNWPTNPSRMGIFPMIWSLGRCSHCNGAHA